MIRRLHPAVAVTLALSTTLALGPAAAAPSSTASHPTARAALSASEGIGDPYYPSDGNPGYNVKNYNVSLDYFPKHETIQATTVIRAKADRDLTVFSLDLDGLTVDAITVDDRVATWTRSGEHELAITPAKRIRTGNVFLTVVTYRGKLHNVDDGGAPSGWISGGGAAGSGYLEGEPHGCATWFPCNDHPTDKATFSLNGTVPRPLALASVGRQKPTTSGMRRGHPVRTYRWRLGDKTATYLVGLYIDRLTFERSRLADGTLVINAYGPNPGKAPARAQKLPKILRVLSNRWGPYPAPQAGGIFVSDVIPYELETYTRPIYSTSTNLTTIVHENGHQWWGDNVSLHRWKDICLNECLASYSEWLWDEHNGANLNQRYRDRVAEYGNKLFRGKLYDMGAGHEFDSPVYVKGKFFVHALRHKVGSADFFHAMRAIQRSRAGGNLSMNGLRDQLERRTSVDLTNFWQEWVLQTGRPSDANLFPGNL